MRKRIVAVSVGVAMAAALLAPLQTGAARAASCATASPSDFNGDGFDDVAVGHPRATVNGTSRAGQVTVLYGDGDGAVGQGARAVLNQDMPGLDVYGETAEVDDQFGFAVAAGHVNTDGCLDLVVGTPYENLGSSADVGAVQVIYGSTAGLGNGEAFGVTQGAAGGDVTEAGDKFGYSLDVGSASSTDTAVIAAGAPGDDVGGAVDAGVVSLLVAADDFGDGLAVDQDTPGVPGAAEPNDNFGHSVALGLLTGGAGRWDLVAGAPFEAVGSRAYAGMVSMVADVSLGASPANAQSWTQNTAGVAGVAEAFDWFGYSLDYVRAGATRYVGVGVPAEDIGSDADAGAVQLFRSTGSGLSPWKAVSQDTAGVAGVTETEDSFGYAIALKGATPGDATVRMAVGAPGEAIGTLEHAGVVQVFPVANPAADVSHHQNQPGVIGVVQAGEEFGHSVAVVEGASEAVLLVGAPADHTYTSGLVHVFPFAGGTPRAWIPGSGGVPAAAPDSFGWGMTGWSG